MDIRPDRPDFRRTEPTRVQREEPQRTSDETDRALAKRLANQAQQERIQSARLDGARSLAARREAAAAEGPREGGSEVDRIDLSEGARAADRLTEGGTAADRLAALRELYQSGRLNSPERLESAAARILGRERPFELG